MHYILKDEVQAAACSVVGRNAFAKAEKQLYLQMQQQAMESR